MALATEDSGLEIGEVSALFPELEIEGEIGQGGFGTVYRATHRRLKRPVALKLLDPNIAHSNEVVTRFGREMEALGRLDYAGIVRAYDAGEREGHWFILMEFVEGEDLAALSRRAGPLSVLEACRIVREAALALANAHGHGLVHRDIKPSNIMISPRGVKLLDFGLADCDSAFDLEPGGFRCTPAYAAPELLSARKDVDARADVYGLGATLFRLLTGSPPHMQGGEESLSSFVRLASVDAAPAIVSQRPNLPAGLAAIIDRMLSPDREKRPPSAVEVASLLAPYATEPSVKTVRFLAASAVVAVACVLVWWFYPVDPQSAIIRRGLNDSADGMLYLNGNPLGKTGRVKAWEIYDGDRSGRWVTPILFRRVNPGRYVIAGVGTSRQSLVEGSQRFEFKPISGSDVADQDTCFGFADMLVERSADPGEVRIVAVNGGVVDASFSGGPWLFTPSSTVSGVHPNVGAMFSIPQGAEPGNERAVPLQGGRTYSARAVLE